MAAEDSLSDEAIGLRNFLVRRLGVLPSEVDKVPVESVAMLLAVLDHICE
jgi:hypothetical protein